MTPMWVWPRFLDHDEIDAPFQERSGGAVRSGEHAPVVLPRGARGLTLALLLLGVELAWSAGQ